MHPLNTLIDSQRHQIRRRSAAPAPARNGLALTTAGALLISIFVVLLATVLI